MLPYTTFLVDLDGVIYRGDELVPGAKEFLNWLETTRKKYLFLTNNSFASNRHLLAKLTRLGIATNSSHILGAGEAAVRNIAHRFPGATVYVVGEAPLMDMVRSHGLIVANDTQHTDKPPLPTIEVVLVGLDRYFDYKKLIVAVDAVRAGATFIAVNRDPLLPIVGGFLPGTGTMVAAIEAASSVTPEVVGKPEPTLLEEAMLMLESRADETLMIGDSLTVDILAGKAAGAHTLLVLSGNTSRDVLTRSSIEPDHVYEDLRETMADILRNRE